MLGWLLEWMEKWMVGWLELGWMERACLRAQDRAVYRPNMAY